LADKKMIRIMTGTPGEPDDEADQPKPEALGRLGKVVLILSLLANVGLAAALVVAPRGPTSEEPPPVPTDLDEVYHPASETDDESGAPAQGVAAAFQWACGAERVGDAVQRLESFIGERVPPIKSWSDEGSWEDEDHWNYALASTYELMRAYYLAGDALRGDALLLDLQADHKSR